MQVLFRRVMRVKAITQNSSLQEILQAVSTFVILQAIFDSQEYTKFWLQPTNHHPRQGAIATPVVLLRDHRKNPHSPVNLSTLLHTGDSRFRR